MMIETPWRALTWQAADGLSLFGKIWPGTSPLPPVLCLPGMTRSSNDFDSLAGFLSSPEGGGRTVLCFDLRGRGRSGFSDPSTYNTLQEADDVARGLKAAGVEQAVFIGTSRGGLVSMTMALLHPELIRATVLNDIGPVIGVHGLARIIGYIGKAPPEEWGEAVACLQRGQGDSFPDLDAAGWERYARQLYRVEGERTMLDYDPALAIAFQAFDPSKPLPDLWPAFDALAAKPVLMVHGRLSDILTDEGLAAVTARHPGVQVWQIPDEGHAPLLWDAPTQTRIASFIAEAAS